MISIFRIQSLGGATAGLFGYINDRGEVVIPPRWKAASEFSCDLAAVNVDGKWGFIDSFGTLTIGAQYDDVSDFSEGCVAASIGPKWGYIDETGVTVIPFRFADAGPFSCGVAPVRLRKGGTCSCVDARGKIVVRDVGLADFQCSEGLFPAECPKTGKTGYRSVNGKWEIEPRLCGGQSFSEGLAAVSVGGATEKEGFINRRGIEVVRFGRYQLGMTRFRCQKAAVFSKEKATRGRIGYINQDGEWVIAPQFYWGDEFSEGIAAAQVSGTGKIGLIAESGEWIVKPRFQHVERFCQGLCWCVENGRGLYLNKNGKVIWNDRRLDKIRPPSA